MNWRHFLSTLLLGLLLGYWLGDSYNTESQTIPVNSVKSQVTSESVDESLEPSLSLNKKEHDYLESPQEKNPLKEQPQNETQAKFNAALQPDFEPEQNEEPIKGKLESNFVDYCPNILDTEKEFEIVARDSFSGGELFFNPPFCMMSVATIAEELPRSVVKGKTTADVQGLQEAYTKGFNQLRSDYAKAAFIVEFVKLASESFAIGPIIDDGSFSLQLNFYVQRLHILKDGDKRFELVGQRVAVPFVLYDDAEIQPYYLEDYISQQQYYRDRRWVRKPTSLFEMISELFDK